MQKYIYSIYDGPKYIYVRDPDPCQAVSRSFCTYPDPFNNYVSSRYELLSLAVRVVEKSAGSEHPDFTSLDAPLYGPQF
jgi:hypothetical protein